MAREDICGLGHEVHPAEDDRRSLGARLGGIRELERVPHEVGVGDHLVPLVEVPEHHDAVAEGRLGCDDARVELDRGGLPVLRGQLALAGGSGGQHIPHRRPGAVAGGAVEFPGGLRERGAARAAGGARGDELDSGVDRGHGGSFTAGECWRR